MDWSCTLVGVCECPWVSVCACVWVNVCVREWVGVGVDIYAREREFVHVHVCVWDAPLLEPGIGIAPTARVGGREMRHLAPAFERNYNAIIEGCRASVCVCVSVCMSVCFCEQSRWHGPDSFVHEQYSSG